MNNFYFSYKAESEPTIIVKTDSETATEVLQAFCYFLRACSYSDRTIAQALDNVLIEMTPQGDKNENDAGIPTPRRP